MKKFYALIFVLLFSLSTVFALLQQDFSKVNLKYEKVAGTVYMIEGEDDMTAFSGGNIGLCVGEDGVIMVDSKMAPLTDKIKATIKQIGGASPKFVINTHVHGDHTGGNAVFAKDGTIIAHTNVRARLMKDKPKELWPVITFDQSLSLHLNGEEIKVLHYPKGHTDGDAVIYFTGSNVVHMGDLMFSGLFPFIDLDSGGTVQGYVEDVKKIRRQLDAGTKIIPGHGPLSDIGALDSYIAMLEQTTGLVTQKMKQGKSLEEIKKEGLPEEWKSWAWFFISTDRWIETIYKSYAGELGNQ